MHKDSKLKEEDLVKDKCYIWYYGKVEYIIYYRGSSESISDYLQYCRKEIIFRRSGSFRLSDRTAKIKRLANKQEQLHLDTCIKKGSYVDIPELIELYKIY